ncbi:8299_t:CDS:2 [Diversispora eburnea]|uniref:8299_t:CDS:1 n=1 Tax=Diversispora eburnea TaxID=1213867 RepID=A0A9N9B811_9GLOM|nr:8299_t:CDS:2 [Diversispora eburnea]
MHNPFKPYLSLIHEQDMDTQTTSSIIDEHEVQIESSKSSNAHAKSKVWDYFNKPYGPLGSRKTKCSICKIEFSYHGSPSSLKYHLKNKHKIDISTNLSQMKRQSQHIPIISLGFYPTSVKLTQKNSKDCVQYQVPDDNSVETEVSKFKIRCETKYQQNNKVRFTIIWKENNSEWTNQPIVHLRKIELDFNGESIILNYKSPNKKNKLNKINSIVRACDKSLLARDGYRQLAAIEPYKNENLFNNFENFEKSNEDIIINDVEIGNGVYRSINTLLKILIPIWKQKTPAIIKSKDIPKLKLGGDGRNVGRKQSQVMMTIFLLNESDEVLKPKNQY